MPLQALELLALAVQPRLEVLEESKLELDFPRLVLRDDDDELLNLARFLIRELLRALRRGGDASGGGGAASILRHRRRRAEGVRVGRRGWFLFSVIRAVDVRRRGRRSGRSVLFVVERRRRRRRRLGASRGSRSGTASPPRRCWCRVRPPPASRPSPPRPGTS